MAAPIFFKGGCAVRKLMWFTIGFAAACALCACCANVWMTECAAFLAVLCSVGAKKWKPLRKATIVLLGCCIGLIWSARYTDRWISDAELLDGKTQTALIRTTDYGYETDYGTAAEGILTLNGKAYKIRAYFDDRVALEPGQEISGDFLFRLTTKDSSVHDRSEGIFLRAYQQDKITVCRSTTNCWQDIPARLRSRIQVILSDCFPGETASFAKALLLGDTADLDYETDTNLKISGIRHVAAVSGLHVSILFALISMVTLHRRVLTALLGFPALLLFTAVAGFTPSVLRACIMSGLMLLALLFDKEYDGATALSFAVLAMLIQNPLVILSIGFQLSVASVAGIFLFSAEIQSWLVSRFEKTKGRTVKAKLIQWFTGSVSVTLSAMVITTPLCAWYFGTVSLIGVVTNLLTLWVVSFIFYGIMAVCLLFFLWNTGAVILAKLVSLPIRYVLSAAELLADFPLAAVYTQSSYIVCWLIFVYLLLLVFLLSKKRQPMVLACCACIGLMAALMASWVEPMLDDTRITVLDVGQGQCILLQSEGRTFMVDCGGDSDSATADTAAEALLSQGIRKLDGLILTHWDRDHSGALQKLLSRIDAEVLLLPDEPSDIPEEIAQQLIYASDDLVISWGSSALHIYASNFHGSSNQKSLCVLFDTKKCDILITGDRNGFGERQLLRSVQIPDVDVLIAGHHGSANSTCEELLSAVQPEIVCISVGEDNPYGHPSSELLQRLSSFGCTVYRTDKSGTITIRR